jgi:hypothetical protein
MQPFHFRIYLFQHADDRPLLGAARSANLTYLVQQLRFLSMPVEKGKTGTWAAKQVGDIFDEIHMTGVAFHERVKVHNVELADANRLDTVFPIGTARTGTVIRRRLGSCENILPSPFENTYACALMPTFMPHPFNACGVAFDDKMFSWEGLLKICVNLDVSSSNMLL